MTAPTQPANVETSTGTPSWAKRWLWRCSGRCRPNLAIITSARRFGPARPRGIGWKGAGFCAMVSQSRQEKRSRTCWITTQRAGIRSRVSVTSSPRGRRRAPPQQAQVVGLGWRMRSRGRCSGKSLRAGLRWEEVGVVCGSGSAACASVSASVSSRSSNVSSSWSIRALRSEEAPKRSRRSRATSSLSRSTAISDTSRAAPLGQDHGVSGSEIGGKRRGLKRVRHTLRRAYSSASVTRYPQPTALGRQLVRGIRQSMPESR